MRYLLVCCLAFVLLAPASIALSATRQAVLEYKLVGLKGSLRDNVLAWLGDAPSSPQSRLNFLVTAEQRVEDSLKALGYYDPEVSIALERTDPVWSMQITVQPGDPVLIRTIELELEGDAAQDPEFRQLLDTAPFRKGDVFSHGDYDKFKNRVLSLGQQRGYFDAQFSVHRVDVNVIGKTADIFLQYNSGVRYRFGDVQYGESRVQASLLEEIQPFSEGDFFDQAKLQTLQLHLQSTNYFSGVLIQPRFEQAKDYKVPISVTLHPAKRHSFNVGFGYSTDTQERISTVWRTPVLNRYGHSQETRIAYSEVNPSGRFTYTIPLSHPLNDVLHLSALVEDNEYGDTESRQTEYAVLREMRRSGWVQSYSGRLLDESWEVKGTKFNNSYTLPGLAFSRSDRSGSVVDPAGGFSQFYKLEAGSEQLGSDVDLARLTANFRYVLTPAPEHRVVTRLALGAVFISDSDRPNLAPSLRFFAGGSQSIRGYAYQSVGNEITVTRDNGEPQKLVIGGERLVTGTLEYQYYFTPSWRGAVFIDAGDAFDEDDMDLKFGPGFGVHYMSPVGAVRLELANGVSENSGGWRVHVNIGAEF